MVGVLRSAGVFLAAMIVIGAAAAPASAARPNVVVIVTDDQTLESFRPEVMPQTFERLAARGTTFSQAIVSTPQCCPSRAGYLTGQYAHNNGVTANRPGYALLRRKRDVLPAWLQAAGYRTVHVGKYLNGYYARRGARPGPGWDRWLTLTDTDYEQPVWSIDGRARAEEEYLTTALNRRAARAAARSAKRRRPFYLQVDHFAPHVGSGDESGRCAGAAIPNPVDEDSFSDAAAPRTPAAGESDVADKPEFIRRSPAPDAEQTEKADHFYGCALAALKSVDRGVASVVGALRRSGELARTMIVFTSDNGFSYLEHRMPLSKGLPYEEHLRVPLVIRPPRGHGIPKRSRSGRRSRAPVANIDLAPTILALARGRSCRDGRRSCRRMDGRSLLPLLRGKGRGWTRSRAIGTSFSINFSAYRRSCRWAGLRTPGTMLVNHLVLPAPDSSDCRRADEYELYDLESDPFQLESAAAVPDELARRLDRLRRCSGIEGRDRPLRRRPFCE